MLPWYTTRESVMTAADIRDTARNKQQVDRACDAGSRAIEGLTQRLFYPKLDTRYFDWPSPQYSRPWRLWLDRDELISLTAIGNRGGSSIDLASVFLNPVTGPPFHYLELDISAINASSFGGSSSFQRGVTVTGLFGFDDTRESVGAPLALINSVATTIDVDDSSGVGVGTLLYGGTGERMTVSNKSFLDTTVTTTTALQASMAQTLIPVSATTLKAGEIILVDSERMRIEDLVGSSVLVTRAWDGSTLATHNTAAPVYALRRLTVQRGVLGTTPGTLLGGVALQRQVYPALIRQLAVAEALTSLAQEGASYARTVGSGDNQRESGGKGILDLRAQVMQNYGKQARIGVI